jgi:hypothetical protein
VAPAPSRRPTPGQGGVIAWSTPRRHPGGGSRLTPHPAAAIGRFHHRQPGQLEADAALWVTLNPLANSNQNEIAEQAIGNRLPAICARSDYAKTGCLMSYGPGYGIEGRDGARYVDRILRGAKPADLPVEQPMKLELVINLQTAQRAWPYHSAVGAVPGGQSHQVELGRCLLDPPGSSPSSIKASHPRSPKNIRYNSREIPSHACNPHMTANPTASPAALHSCFRVLTPSAPAPMRRALGRGEPVAPQRRPLRAGLPQGLCVGVVREGGGKGSVPSKARRPKASRRLRSQGH